MRGLQATRGASLNAASGDGRDSTVDDRGTGREPAPDPQATPPVRQTRLLAVVAAAVLAADLVTKVVVVATLADRPPVRALDGLVYLVHTRNTGAAFSLAAGFTAVLSLIAMAVIAFIVRTARRLYSSGWAVALGLILGGATGNLVDRLFRAPGPLRGGVVDFIALFDPYQPPWPVFNLADSALVAGVFLVVFLELTGRRINGQRVGHSRHG